jgi:hypothetical protein
MATSIDICIDVVPTCRPTDMEIRRLPDRPRADLLTNDVDDIHEVIASAVMPKEGL